MYTEEGLCLSAAVLWSAIMVAGVERPTARNCWLRGSVARDAARSRVFRRVGSSVIKNCKSSFYSAAAMELGKEFWKLGYASPSCQLGVEYAILGSTWVPHQLDDGQELLG